MACSTFVTILPEWQRIQQNGRIIWDFKLFECAGYTTGNLLVPLVSFRWLLRLACRQSPDRSPRTWMPAPNRSTVLRSSTKRFRLMVLVPLAVWGMIFVGGAAYMLFFDWKVGDPVWPIVVVACLAAAVAAVSAVAIHAFLAWFNPPVRLRLDRDTLRLGESAQLFWELCGRTDHVGRLRIDLECREERRDGKYVSRQVFARVGLIDTTDAGQIASGSVNIDLPIDVMHSLQTPRRSITWSICVNGEISRHPDVFEEFPLTLLPAMPRTRTRPFIDDATEHSVGDGDGLGITTGFRRTFAPGETIVGSVTWQFDNTPAAMELRLFWYTSETVWYGGDVQIVATRRFKPLEPRGRRAFEFSLPEGPWSCSGRLVSLTWALELVVLPLGKAQRLDFVMSPTGRPISPPGPS